MVSPALIFAASKVFASDKFLPPYIRRICFVSIPSLSSSAFLTSNTYSKIAFTITNYIPMIKEKVRRYNFKY